MPHQHSAKPPSVRFSPSVCPLSRAAIGSPDSRNTAQILPAANRIGSRVICPSEKAAVQAILEIRPCAAPLPVSICRIVRQRMFAPERAVDTARIAESRQSSGPSAGPCTNAASAACDPENLDSGPHPPGGVPVGGGGVPRPFHIYDTLPNESAGDRRQHSASKTANRTLHSFLGPKILRVFFRRSSAPTAPASSASNPATDRRVAAIRTRAAAITF